MTATVHHIRPTEPGPLAELNAERERLGKELDRFAVVDQRFGAITAKIAEIDQALGALDRADREAVERWAESAEGDPPTPLLDERKALMARRLDAEAERQGAEIAVAAVAGKRTALIHEMNRVGARIKERQIGAALEQAREIHAEALKIADELCGRLQHLMGLRSAIITMTTEAARRNDADQARALNAALAEVEALGRPNLLADPATVEAHAARWLEALR